MPVNLAKNFSNFVSWLISETLATYFKIMQMEPFFQKFFLLKSSLMVGTLAGLMFSGIRESCKYSIILQYVNTYELISKVLHFFKKKFIFCSHPSCSRQHAVLQYRMVNNKVKPYVIDLNSSNGTYLNNQRIDPQRYVELREKDVVKFGYSSREYVLLHENSNDWWTLAYLKYIGTFKCKLSCGAFKGGN